MKVYIVRNGEHNEGLDITHDGDKPLVFADYAQAFEAFKGVVADRLARLDVTYSYGDFGPECQPDITANGTMACGYGVDDCDCEPSDLVTLTAFEVIGA